MITFFKTKQFFFKINITLIFNTLLMEPNLMKKYMNFCKKKINSLELDNEMIFKEMTQKRKKINEQNKKVLAIINVIYEFQKNSML